GRFVRGDKRIRTRTSFWSAKTAIKKVDDRSVRSRPFEPRRIWCRLARRADHAVVHEGPQLHQGESVVSSWLLSLFRQCRRLTPRSPLTAVSILLRPMSTMRARPRALDRETHGPVPCESHSRRQLFANVAISARKRGS